MEKLTKKKSAIEMLRKKYFATGMLYETDFDEAKQMEREQIVNAFSEGTRMVDIQDELSARFNACVYYADTFNDE